MDKSDGLHSVTEGQDFIVFASESSTGSSYLTNADKCTCKFFCNLGLPCAHIFFMNKKNGNDCYVPTICNKRWTKAYMNATSAKVGSRKILTEIEKYSQAKKVCEEIAQFISHKSTEKFNYYMNNLKLIPNMIKNEELFAVALVEVIDLLTIFQFL